MATQGRSVVDVEQNDQEARRLLEEWLYEPGYRAARRQAGDTVTEGFTDIAVRLSTFGHILGPDRAEGRSSRGHGSDEVVGVATLLQIAGELCAGAVPALDGNQQYVGAALLRQLVEVEYLMWSYAAGKADAKEWLDSDRDTRRRIFSAKHLRDRAGERFNWLDYAHHCDQGGHPTPMAALLLGGREPLGQLLLGDLLLHTWRTWDSVVTWSAGHACIETVAEVASEVRGSLALWGEIDPLYEAVRVGDFMPPRVPTDGALPWRQCSDVESGRGMPTPGTSGAADD